MPHAPESFAVGGAATINIRFGKSSIYNPKVQESDARGDAQYFKR